MWDRASSHSYQRIGLGQIMYQGTSGIIYPATPAYWITEDEYMFLVLRGDINV